MFFAKYFLVIAAAIVVCSAQQQQQQQPQHSPVQHGGPKLPPHPKLLAVRPSQDPEQQKQQLDAAIDKLEARVDEMHEQGDPKVAHFEKKVDKLKERRAQLDHE